MLYFDSSALIKKYVCEAGSDEIWDIFENSGIFITSKLTYPEILSGLERKKREKGISEKACLAAISDFEFDWLNFFIIEFQDELFPIMKNISAKYAIKGADMVHLASALWTQASTHEKIQFITSDLQLIRAAKAEKLNVINPVN